MKRNLLICSILLSCLCCSIGFGQGTMLSNRFPVERQISKIGQKQTLRSIWGDQGANREGWQDITWDPEFRKMLGISDEQFEQIKQGSRFDMDEFQKKSEEMNKYRNPDDPHFLKADEATKRNYLEAYEKYSKYLSDGMPKLERFLTPEQMQLMKETQLALMPETPIVNPSSYDALGLTEEQKEQMKAIQKEMTPEFEKMIEEKVELEAQMQDKVVAAMRAKGLDETDTKVFNENVEAIYKELSQNREFAELQSKGWELGRDFIKRFKFRMFDVLTDEQLDKLNHLLNHPSEYVKNQLAKMRKLREDFEMNKTWRPGPSSWQPGDPIPEEYMQKRKARFPKR